ncbi:M-phase inducer phosphatase-like isoform X2 [Liolophura sinensis]|uniref:M-phase inducer phosphatase-like isoform X2 n=1 Tax=Liolophura sinensis TaxID=3198878 RepID=UPI003158507D
MVNIQSFGDTPRRKLSLSSTESTPVMTGSTPDTASSVESGCFMDSPGSTIDSPTIEMSLQKRFPGISLRIDDGSGGYKKQRSLPFRRLNSLPMPAFRLSPVDFHEKENSGSAPMETSCNSGDTDAPTCTSLLEDEGSQDSGVGFEKDHSERFCFAAPVGMPPRRGSHLRVISEDTCSPQKYSPVKQGTSPQKFRSLSLSSVGCMPEPQPSCSSPISLKTSALTSLDDDSDNDDGFLEVLDKEVAEINDCALPNSFDSLFKAPVINSSSACKEDSFMIRRNPKKLLNRSQSLDVRSRLCNKRQSPGRDDDSTPVQKRRRGSCVAVGTVVTPPKAILKRCHSETEAMIKTALDRVVDDPDLIGDCSKTFCLPTVSGKHQDLKSITPETLSKVIDHEYDHIVEQYSIIDCRYPYEYEGGHILGAKNYYTKESILSNLIDSPRKQENSFKRSILIFHCEFSSERGPNLSRFLRNMDRGQNKEVYPQLYYPEIYLLDGGYKNFFETQKQYCVPQTYMPMHHQDYKEELRKFRIKSKSWAGEKKSSRSALFKGF